MSSVMVEDCDSSDDEHQQAEVDSPISLHVGTAVGASDAPSLPTKDLNARAAEGTSGTDPVKSTTLKLESMATFNEDAVSADIVGFGDSSSSTAPDLEMEEKAVIANIPTDPFSLPEAGAVSYPTTEVAPPFFDSPLAAPAGGMCESNTPTSIMIDEQNTGDHSKDAFNLMEETVIDLIPQQSLLEEEEKGTNHSENTATGDGHSEATGDGKSEAAVGKDEAIALEGEGEREIPSSIIEESDGEAIEDAQLIASPATRAIHAESVPVIMNITSLVGNVTTATATAAGGAAAAAAAADGAAADFDDPFAELESENHGGVGFPYVASTVAPPFDLLDMSLSPALLPPQARDADPVREGGEEGKGEEDEEGVKSRSRVEESTILDSFGMIDVMEDDPHKYGEKEGEISEKEERGNRIKEEIESACRNGGGDIHDAIEARAEGVENKQEEKEAEKEEEKETLFSVAISASSGAVSGTDEFDFEGAKKTTLQADVCIDRSVAEEGEEGEEGRDIEGEKDTEKEVEVAREEVEEVVPQESMDVGNSADGTESAQEIKNAVEEAAVWEGKEEKGEEVEHTTDGAGARLGEVEYSQAPTAGELQHQQLQENKETVEQKNDEEEEEEEEDWDDFAGPTSFESAPDPSAVPVTAPVADTLPSTAAPTATASVIGSGELREVERASGVSAGGIILHQQGTQEEGEMDDFGFGDEEDFQGWESSTPATAATVTTGTAVNATAVPVSEVSASTLPPPDAAAAAAATPMNAPQQRVMPYGASAESVISSTAFSSVGTSEAGLVRAAHAAREKQLLTGLLNEAVIDMKGASCYEESKSSQLGGAVLEALVADYANFWLQSFDILAPLPSLFPLTPSPAPTGDISLLSEPKPPKIVAVSAETGKISDQVFDIYCAAHAQLLVTLRDHYLPPDALPMTELERAITIRDLQMRTARREQRSQRHSCERDCDGQLHDSSISLAEGGESKSALKGASVGSSIYLKDTAASYGNDGAGAKISGTNGADVRGKGARNGNSDGSFHTGAEVVLSPAARAFLLSLPDLSFMLEQ